MLFISSSNRTNNQLLPTTIQIGIIAEDKVVAPLIFSKELVVLYKLT